MEVHRLRSVIDTLIAEHARLGIDQKLGHLLQALGACSSNPSAASDERFRGALTDLLTTLRRCRTNDFAESQRQILLQIRGEPFTGNGLARRLLDVANERPFLPALARETCVEIADDLQSYLGACASAQAALHKLNVGPVPSGEDAWELAVLMPEVVAQGDLQRLLGRMREWDGVLGDLLGAISPKQPVVKLRDYSAGRLELSVAVDRDTAGALATAIAGTYEIFRKIRGNRERVADLERQSYPPEIVERLRDYEQGIIAAGMKAIPEELARFVRPDAPRRRDAEKVLERWLQFVVAQLQDGVEVEVIGPSLIDAAPTDDQGDPITHHVRAALGALRQARADEPETAAATAEETAAEAEERASLSLARARRGKQEAA